MMTYPDFKYRQIAVHIAGGSKEKLRFRADKIIIEDEEGKVHFTHSCHRLFVLFILGECSLTSIAIRNATKYAFPIVLMNHNCKVITRINCGADGNTLLRRLQYTQTSRNAEIACALVQQKLKNQIQLMKRLRYHSEEDKQTLQKLQDITIQSNLQPDTLRGLEGTASRLFFASYFRPLKWARREPRCKRDIYNLLLDIGYTYLFNFVDAMLSLYGFDLYCGVYHTFFYQRKSLVCDIIEPFRCIIDHRLRKAHNLGQIDVADFTLKNNAYSLNWKAQGKYARLFLKDILEHKKAIFTFCQSYYRWTMKQAPIENFPTFCIGE